MGTVLVGTLVSYELVHNYTVGPGQSRPHGTGCIDLTSATVTLQLSEYYALYGYAWTGTISVEHSTNYSVGSRIYLRLDAFLRLHMKLFRERVSKIYAAESVPATVL